MKYSQMLKIIDAAGCTPEEFGAILGVSGMTLRRWRSKPKNDDIPKLYVPAIREACYELIASGRLLADSEGVRELLIDHTSNQYAAAIENLGLPKDFSIGNATQENLVSGLNHIGNSNQKQTEVNENRTRVFSYKSLGKEWSSRISFLWKIISSSKLTQIDKLVAYGALFYLLTPIDFIPDQIPFFGLIDDFGVLGLAVAYYAKRFNGSL